MEKSPDLLHTKSSRGQYIVNFLHERFTKPASSQHQVTRHPCKIMTAKYWRYYHFTEDVLLKIMHGWAGWSQTAVSPLPLLFRYYQPYCWIQFTFIYLSNSNGSRQILWRKWRTVFWRFLNYVYSFACSVYVCSCAGTHMTWCTCGGRRMTCRS